MVFEYGVKLFSISDYHDYVVVGFEKVLGNPETYTAGGPNKKDVSRLDRLFGVWLKFFIFDVVIVNYPRDIIDTSVGIINIFTFKEFSTSIS